MNIAKFSVKNRLFVNLVSVMLIVGGIYCAVTQKREAFPRTSFDIVIINTVYTGASPKEIEKLITNPIEQEIKEIDGIDKISSDSREGSSSIVVEIDPGYGNTDKVINNVQRAVDRVDGLPNAAEDPIVLELSSEHPAIEVSLSGSVDEKTLRLWADNLRKRLELIDGVGSVKRNGWRDPEIWIEVDPEKLKEYQISLLDVITALKTRNISFPGGKLTHPDTEYLIRTDAEFSTPEEIADVIVRANDVGNFVRIRDIAVIKETYQEQNIIQKTLGTRSINLIIMKKESGDTISIVNTIFEEVNRFKDKIPSSITVSFVNDMSFYIKRRLRVLINNGWMGFLMVFIILRLFLNFRTTAVVAIGVPISMLATFIGMRFSGISINLLSMFGLIVVLGMLVDDAIIVAENIYRHIEKGCEPEEAAVIGTTQVMKPVVASVLTTMAAFLPFLFMSGIMGKFVRNIPLPLMIALAASLMESFFILPSHMADFVKSVKKKRATHTGNEAGWYKKLIKSYTKVLTLALRRRYIFAGLMIALLAFSLFWAKNVMRFVLFSQEGIEIFFIRAEAQVGTSLEAMNTLIKPIEDEILKLPEHELDTFITQIGVVQQDPGDPMSRYGSHLSQCVVYLTPPAKRKRTADDIILYLRGQIPAIKNVKLSFDRVNPGPPVGKPIAVEIRGEEFDVLNEIADKMILEMKKIPGIKDIDTNYKMGKEEIRVVVDREKAKIAGLSVQEIASMVRIAFEGGVATTIKKTEEEIDVVVKYPPEARKKLSTLENLLIANKKGRLIPLKKVASLSKGQGLSSIAHVDNRRLLKITAQIDPKVTTTVKANNEINKRTRDIQADYSEYVIKFGGEMEDTQKSMKSLFEAFGFAFLLIFLIIATTFKSIIHPLVIMLTIPFGIVGVIWAFYFHGMPISFLGILGMVALSGVAVNDSIVLVDFINRRRKEEGQSRFDSIISSGQSRLRPIILTTITTMGGLIPLAYGWIGSDPFLKPMAIAIVWGLFFASGQTLIVIPCFYAIVDDAGEFINKTYKKILGRDYK